MSEAAASGISVPTAAGESKGADTTNATGKRVYVPENKPKQKPVEQQKQEAPVSDFRSTKHKVKFGDREEDVDYEELIRGYQNGKESTRRYQEAAQMSKQSKEVIENLESGNVKWLVDKLGPQKAKDLFEQFLIEDMEYEALPESEKRAREAEKKLQAYEEQEKARKAEDEDRRKVAFLERAHEEIDEQVAAALEKVGRKPSPRLVLRIVDDMIAGLGGDESGQWDADKAAHKAIQSVHQDIVEFLRDVPASELVKLLPEPVLKSIRQHEVNQVMGEKSQTRVKAERPAVHSQKKKTIAEAFNDINKRFTR